MAAAVMMVLLLPKQTCRRLHEISRLELPWIELWRRLALADSLPPLRPESYTRPLEHTEPLQASKTVTLQVPYSYPASIPLDSLVNSPRYRIQRILDVQHRLHASENTICAREINLPVISCPEHEFIDMAMTAEGEVLVVWEKSGLRVVDLRYVMTLTLQFAHPTTSRRRQGSVAAAMCEYKGSVGVLIAGEFVDGSKISVLFQELPQQKHETTKGASDYVILLDIPVPLSGSTSVRIAAGYLYFVIERENPRSREVNVVSFQSAHTVITKRTQEQESVQLVQVCDDKLLLYLFSGNIKEYPLIGEVGDPPSSTLSLHSNVERRWFYAYCEAAKESLTPQRSGPPLSHSRYWRLSPSTGFTNSITANLAMKPLEPHYRFRTARSRSALLEFRPNPQHFPEATPKISPGNPSTLSQIPSSSPNGSQVLKHIWSQAGHSTLLSHLCLSDERDGFMLSHAPQAGIKGGRVFQPEPWETQYKTILLETRDGTSRAPTHSIMARPLEYVRRFLWNEWAGRFVLASVNTKSKMLTVGIYQM
ncbi:hypothetical protein DL93DRAFT_2078003 [Clavulina sp. PMI_390]|nr:hypothetical protein DL93DRAFT_2078003 [Clavulina sp. PMI_390]